MSSPEDRLPSPDHVLEGEDLTPEQRQRILGRLATFALEFGNDSRKDELLQMIDLLEQRDEIGNRAVWERIARRATDLNENPVRSIEGLEKERLKATLEAHNKTRVKILEVDAVLLSQPMRASHVLRDLLRFIEEELNRTYQEYDSLNNRYGGGESHE